MTDQSVILYNGIDDAPASIGKKSRKYEKCPASDRFDGFALGGWGGAVIRQTPSGVVRDLAHRNHRVFRLPEGEGQGGRGQAPGGFHRATLRTPRHREGRIYGHDDGGRDDRDSRSRQRLSRQELLQRWRPGARGGALVSNRRS